MTTPKFGEGPCPIKAVVSEDNLHIELHKDGKVLCSSHVPPQWLSEPQTWVNILNANYEASWKGKQLEVSWWHSDKPGFIDIFMKELPK